MKQTTPLEKELDDFAKKVYSTNTLLKPDYIVGLYRYWARIEAIENVLVKNGLVKSEEIDQAMIPILRGMKKDFKKRLSRQTFP